MSNLFLSATLLFSAATLKAEEMVVKTPLDLPGYCHMQFPEMRSDTLSWNQPMLDEGSGKIIDFYGSCNHDPTGADAVRAQRRVMLRGVYGDGD